MVVLKIEACQQSNAFTTVKITTCLISAPHNVFILSWYHIFLWLEVSFNKLTVALWILQVFFFFFLLFILFYFFFPFKIVGSLAEKFGTLV